MARKPKTQPNPDNTVAVQVPEPTVPDEAAAPARRGRKSKAATLSFASPPAADVGSPSPDDARADAPKAAPTEAAADSDPVQPDRDPGSPASEAAQSAPEAKASVPAEPAAHWDQATDTVEFDWPTIERVAAQGGPNQGMAKLLVAARAEGTSSRWPF